MHEQEKGAQATITKRGPESIDAIQPLWEALNRHHADVSSHFTEHFEANDFDKRRAYLLAKAERGPLRIFMAEADAALQGYCVCTLSEGHGAIESLYVLDSRRGSGLGSRLMEAALAWLDAHGAVTKSLDVVHGNDAALSFYARLGFQPASVVLKMK